MTEPTADHMPWYGAIITVAIVAFVGGGLVVMVGRTLGEAIARRVRSRHRGS